MRRTLALTTAALVLSALPHAVAQSAPAKPAATAQAASANDASKRAKVEQMLALTKTDTLSQNMLASVPVRVKTLAARQPMVASASSPEQKKLANDYLDQMGKIGASAPGWAVLKPKVVDLYMAQFTEADLDGILAFFKTAPGQDYLAKSPELSQKTVELLQNSVNALAPQFEAATRAFQTNMQNTSPAGGGEAAPGKAPTLGPPTLKPRQ